MRRLAADAPIPAAAPSGWQARLALGFADDNGTTRLVERTHSGPLRVQKPLYPEGPRVCQAIVVHPPGGVAGGDELMLRMHAAPGCAALVTTPGAGKWYKANGKRARQRIHIAIDAGASLEWLPQESIVFDAADVTLEADISLAAGAAYLGCEILCFGRTASGERFQHGRLAQRTTLRIDGRLAWFEQGQLAAESSAMHSPLGLAGKTVCATFLAAGKSVPASVIATLREQAAPLVPDAAFGVTQLKSVIAVRYLGHSSEQAKAVMALVWRQLRPALTGRDAVIPRIWNT